MGITEQVVVVGVFVHEAAVVEVRQAVLVLEDLIVHGSPVGVPVEIQVQYQREPAVEELPNVPLLLWCYTPYTRLPEQMSMRDLFRASGPVGALQASGPLKRLGRRFGFAFGSYESQETVDRIVEEERRHIQRLAGMLATS